MNAFDVIIVGSGLAGATAALRLADHSKVAVLTKRSLQDGASNWAQGGIAAVMGEDDQFELHIQDTLTAGAGLCDESATRFIIEHAPESIRWLETQGVDFTHENGHLHLTREGGHSRRRIVHAADATGAEVLKKLHPLMQAHPNITLLDHYMLVDLITTHKSQQVGDHQCVGLYALNEISGEVETFQSKNTILATGGAGKVYLYTTNPDTATGDGIAAAWRAGCRVSNMEFIQFHPTCLYHPEAKSFLISEAVRGEGGQLQLPDGTRFMAAHDERMELAPRDIVARAIDFEMKRHGIDCVYLDIRHKGKAFITEHFPTIYERCLELGIDMAQDRIPVVPAAHYTCGGVLTDLQGRTDLHSLYAVGETACTGLHGANRLASNSLLECVVIATSAVTSILHQATRTQAQELAPWDSSQVTDADEEVVISHNWDELRRFMWDYVGIVRTDKRLERALHRLKLLREEIREFYANFHVTRDLLELRNLVLVSALIVHSAKARHESRGLHFSRDYPFTLEQASPTILAPHHHRDI